MTMQDAKKAGYDISRGAYYGTTDDRADRWYISEYGGMYRRRGEGFRTRKEALDYLEIFVESLEVAQ